MDDENGPLRVVLAMNLVLRPGTEDFDVATVHEAILDKLGDDAPEMIEGRPLADWLRDALEANRRSRRGRRGYETQVAKRREEAKAKGRTFLIRPRPPYQGRGAAWRTKRRK